MSALNLAKLKTDLIQQLSNSFPGLRDHNLENLISENLISPFHIELPASVLKQAQDIVSTLFKMREQPSYQTYYQNLLAAKELRDPGNKSIVMSYDFHLDEKQNLKLIEVNTNAGFLALGCELYKAKQLPLPIPHFDLDEIAQDVSTELKLQGKTAGSDLKIAIIDNKPTEQRLYVEFLVYQELFKSQGWDCRILDYPETFKDFAPDFIYNRHTDFYLSEPDAAALKEKFMSGQVCLSPNPFEYFLLADKQRLIDWSQEGFFNQHNLSEEEIDLLKGAVPQSYDVTAQSAEHIWGLRKKLFLKPKNAFGSKQSYKGASISRKAFDELIKQETIAQEYIVAPEANFETPDGIQSFKYDLRCYAYQGRLQLVAARLYQGQVTNARTPFGGFACVRFK